MINYKDILNEFDVITRVTGTNSTLKIVGTKSDKILVKEVTYKHVGVAKEVRRRLRNFIDIKGSLC
jgi:hypothetical protein